MALEYAWRGLVGVLTPQANTTVEPEFGILWPPGVAMLNARMLSTKGDMEARLVEYFDRLDEWVSAFANAPIQALAIACTGASYLAGVPRERMLADGLQDRLGIPVVTAGTAVTDAFRALDACRVAIVSPYPAGLTALGVAYWTAQGFDVAEVVAVAPGGTGTFHPIYSMAASDARLALDRLDTVAGLDAVVMLGTGMPTLGPILNKPRAGGAPVLSCMVATAWRTVQALEGVVPDMGSLLQWIDEPDWRGRYDERMKLQI